MRVFINRRGHRPDPCAATLAALLGFAAFAQAAPFTNGSFESPGGSTTELGVGSTHVTGWVHGVTSGAEFYTTSNHFSIPAGDGSFYITWGGVGIVGGTLSQTFDTTPGTTYAVNYLLTTQQFFTPPLPVQSNSVQAFDGATLLNSTTNSFNMAAGVWLAGNQLTFTATSASTTLVFTDTTTPQNSPPINWGLDAVTLSELPRTGGAVPEPATYTLAPFALAIIGLAQRKRHDRLKRWTTSRNCSRG